MSSAAQLRQPRKTPLRVAATGSSKAARRANVAQPQPKPQPAPQPQPAAIAPVQKETAAGNPSDLAPALLAYQVDFWQRSVLYLDTLRERGDNMLEHQRQNMPPLLDFEYELLLDARRFTHPANYALLRVTGAEGERHEDCEDPAKPPVIIIDPRAGHGPGIGGFKRDSEVGMALHQGHPVYFVAFFPEPVQGQTLADVLHAQRRFVEEVVARHPGKPPVLYGNCQAGWAVALISADCEGLVGPAVLSGAPLSYWAGAPEVNPMRLLGGLLGGSWLAHLTADLGDGRFDGAWLAQNFEALNPANTIWDKNYHLFANIDTERERFLGFERWWSGFYSLGREEITNIVDNLFIGNRIENGTFEICPGCTVDLTRIKNPLVIFASSGDNISPPHQALNWIPTVYPDTEALKAAGQRIVYLINPHAGHLGIFVSAKVARLEHRAILENLGELEDLAPGLYEMKIDNPTGDPDCRKPQYQVRFEERKVEDIHYDYPRDSFQQVHEVSEINESLYNTFLSPWVRAFTTPWSADLLRDLHPARTQRLLFSSHFNPWSKLLEDQAESVRAHRAPVAADNPLKQWESQVSQAISQGLETYRQLRDAGYEQAFQSLYAPRIHQESLS